MKQSLRLVVVACALGAACMPTCSKVCWEEAALLYGVSSSLLVAVARTESNLDPSAVNLTHRSRTGSYDIGLMQINSSHLPALAAAGITERDLYEPCTNIKVGAWLLASLFTRYGASWNAVGAYSASCSRLKGEDCKRARARYAWKVYRSVSPSQQVAAPVGPIRPPITTDRIVGLSSLLSARVDSTPLPDQSVPVSATPVESIANIARTAAANADAASGRIPMTAFTTSTTLLLAATCVGPLASSCAVAPSEPATRQRPVPADIAQRPTIVGSPFVVCSPCERRTLKTLATATASDQAQGAHRALPAGTIAAIPPAPTASANAQGAPR